MTARVRTATLSDAPAIAHVHVQAWRETYRGLVPDSVLAGLSVERRVQAWSGMLAPEAEDLIVVAETDDGIIGFGAASRTRDALLATDGEITSIYLRERYKRQGLGRILFDHLMVRLRDRGCQSVGLWVLDANIAARRFYERLGGRRGPDKVDDRKDVALHEVAYVWRDTVQPSHPK